ncbi:hypothetical protein MLD38_008487 [Melastoma candidum]|uniref:Uncharacterized protein n=1 Tax=Melastoma candidum TaxID=119954 RepID=A0ACB9RY68_9MYRT|nr:hypothetical protein MLD38_008487 [Melastoma candidum]
MSAGYDINKLCREARFRWLKPAEIHFILLNHQESQRAKETPQLPNSGSLFLYDKKVNRFFRRDGHNWRKKKDQRTVGEAHERLKVGNVEALNCYYAHGEDNPNFQRRSYWILDPAYEHIVLVHYRDITEGKPTFESDGLLSPESSPGLGQIVSPGSYGDGYQRNTSLSDSNSNLSPGSAEVSSGSQANGPDHMNGDTTTEFGSSCNIEVGKALKRIEEQLSLNDDEIKELEPFLGNDEDWSRFQVYEVEASAQNQLQASLHGPESCKAIQHPSEDNGFCGKTLHHLPDYYAPYFESPSHENDSSFWSEILESSENLASSGRKEPMEESQDYWLDLKEVDEASSLPYAVDLKLSSFPSMMDNEFTNPDELLHIPGNVGLTVAEKQKFTILEVCPDWGYTSESTKVIIVGSFLSDSPKSTWRCMFGDIEVPVDIIQEGVIRCNAPPHLPGKVTLCITSGNRESCSEVREFEYRIKPTVPLISNFGSNEVARSPDELLLLVSFAQVLLCDSLGRNNDNTESDDYQFGNLKAVDDSWSHIVEALLMNSESSLETTNWLLEKLLKDKLQNWVSLRWKGQDQTGCCISKEEQGVIHMVAGLGFEWALTPILKMGVNVNYRDINGWTALHWAAKYGREKMVATLMASGALPGAVTDPTSDDPTGKRPADVAAMSGHKGLAGYLSEKALTSHLSSLTLEENDFSRSCAELEADRTINSLNGGFLSISEDQLSLKDTLAAVRAAAQAAARIQLAFRAHSFKRRQAADAAAMGDYRIIADGIQGLSGVHKLQNARDHHSAALSIQKKYRGWKGRKDFLSLRQRVVKIQAHVRGYQVRKHYRVFCWAVGILDRVILRWRRKGVGLRSFQPEMKSIEDSEDEDIIKVFRKEKVETAINDAVSRVLSMVDSSEARQQYRRMLEKYRQAKAELGSVSSEEATPTVTGVEPAESMNYFP